MYYDTVSGKMAIITPAPAFIYDECSDYSPSGNNADTIVIPTSCLKSRPPDHIIIYWVYLLMPLITPVINSIT